MKEKSWSGLSVSDSFGPVLKALAHGTSWQWRVLPAALIKNQEGMWFSKDPLEVRYRRRHPCVHAGMMLGPWWHWPSSQPPLSYTWHWLAISGGMAKGQSDPSVSVPREAAVSVWQQTLLRLHKQYIDCHLGANGMLKNLKMLFCLKLLETKIQNKDNLSFHLTKYGSTPPSVHIEPRFQPRRVQSKFSSCELDSIPAGALTASQDPHFSFLRELFSW